MPPPPPLRARLLVLAAVVAVLQHAPRAARAETTLNDVIGRYVLYNVSSLVADASYCPSNLTVRTFTFEDRDKPARLPFPVRFNALVRHVDTLLDGRSCTSGGGLLAVQNDHPFIGNEQGALDAWARAGWGTPANWISDNFLSQVEGQSYVIGYEFSERICGDSRLRPGTAFLWFEPAWDLLLHTIQLRASVKWLLLTFQGQRKFGCVYLADELGGGTEFPPGPVADPTNPDASPPPTSPPPTITPQPSPLGTFPPESDGTPKPSPTRGGVFDEVGNAPPDDGSGAGSCFPASATVELSDGSRRRMADLHVGDTVRATNAVTSDVFFFSHRALGNDDDAASKHPYVSVRTASGATVTLSEGHYVHLNDRLIAASDVREGDSVTLANGKADKVVGVDRVWMHGKFAPHTLHGDIVVDGVLVSTYTTAVHPLLAHHVLLRPVRWLYRLGLGGLFEGTLDQGAETLRRFLPSGPKQASLVV